MKHKLLKRVPIRLSWPIRIMMDPQKVVTPVKTGVQYFITYVYSASAYSTAATA
jgi:hypothetical protein